MRDLDIPTPAHTRLSWDYTPRTPQLQRLYQRAQEQQWSAAEDLDWTQAVPFGAPLPDGTDFARASFEASPMAVRGRPMWDTFRWELQSWLVSQFLHGEQAALAAAARLVQELPDVEAKLCAASQVADEARHVEVFSRYLREKIPQPYAINEALHALLEDVLTDARWDITALGMQIVVEALAMAAFRLAGTTFHDPLIRRIAALVARDEARHVSFGVLSLRGVYRELTAAERADREDMVLDAASLMRRRFLLADLWERLEVDHAAGVRFAAGDRAMVAYRRTVFTRVVSALDHIDLLTDRVREGLDRLDLLGDGSQVRRPAGRTG
ncbi:ferritin-like domain-containing protein [Streptomyces sp. NBC_00083]|uniref:ferritin-like domain-containing protein n=1 Tax=Streptomyces sp. NBC_00083 TaxID=2975647 RepID=UPI002255F259|nr:ferritin-like domain-containing protein [Streptomyces sp. NBC_00083]MCX5384764.1 ferritin-like domain-containing protein [Streptomyces sp. NBC_00083]